MNQDASNTKLNGRSQSKESKIQGRLAFMLEDGNVHGPVSGIRGVDGRKLFQISAPISEGGVAEVPCSMIVVK
jgi:hypothetical protein